MRRVERLGRLADELDRPHRLEASLAAEHLAQVGAVHVLEREVEPAVVLARGDRPDDVGMVERRRQPRLAQETAAETVVVCELRREQL